MSAPAEKHGLFGRLLRGLASTVVYQAIAVASAVLLVPLYLHAWGADGYGRWLTLTAFIAYFSLLDLGGQNFIGNILTRAYARTDMAQFRSALEEGLSLFSVIAMLGLFVLLFIVLVPYEALGVLSGFTVSDRYVLFFMGFGLLLSIPQGVYVTVFRASGRFVQGMMLGNILRLFILIVLGAILLLGVDQAVYSAVNAATVVFLSIAVFVYASRQVPGIRRIRLSWRSFREGRKHISGSLLFWSMALAQSLRQQGVILVLGIYHPAAAVAVFATHRTAVGLLGYISNIFQAPIWPELTMMHAKGEIERLARFSMHVMRIVVFFTATAALILWLVLPYIYVHWTNRMLALDPHVLTLLLAQGVFAAGWGTISWPMLASNNHRSLSIWSIVNATATVGLSFLLIPRFSSEGAALALFTADMVFSLAIIPFLSARMLHVPVSRIFYGIVSPIAGLGVLGFLLSISTLSIESAELSALVKIILLLICLYPMALITVGRGTITSLRKAFVQKQFQV